MKRILAIMLACLLAVTTVAFAEGAETTQEPAAQDDLAIFLGKTLKDLAAELGELKVRVYEEYKSGSKNGVQYWLTVEGGIETGLEPGKIFEIKIMFTPDYCLDGYRVDQTYHEAVNRALAEGWVLSKDAGDKYTYSTYYEKTVEDRCYELYLFSGDSVSEGPCLEMVGMTVTLLTPQE